MSERVIDSKSREQLSLENCDREAIHIPGNVQPFSVVLATDAQLKNIEFCSANASEIFDYEAEDILGLPLTDLLSASLVHDLRNTLSLSSVLRQRERLGGHEEDDLNCEIWVHISNGRPVLEFERVVDESLSDNRSILQVRSLLARFSPDQSLQKVIDEAVVGLRHLSGFDRVMLYKFDESGDGEVMAEARGPSLDAFLGLRFPKWDIPNQARTMMQKSLIRVIVDVTATPVELLSNSKSDEPLDMSRTAARGVSPIHCKYLSNMHVRSSMTLTVTVKGKLWGLFAFHHSQPRHVGPSLRGAFEVFVQFFALQMEQRLETEFSQIRADVFEYQRALINAVESATSLKQPFSDLAEPLCDLVGAQGISLIGEDGVTNFGQTPQVETSKAIARRALAEEEDSMFVTSCLADEGFDALPVAGALAFNLGEGSGNCAIFFRAEAKRSIAWAGAPSKEIKDVAGEPRLQPRGSFKHYLNSVEGHSVPWDYKSVFAGECIRIALAKADTTLYRRLKQKDERQRSIFIAELNHRVKNILSLVRSLSRRTKSSSHSIESYAEALEQRIVALGKAHDLATNQIANGAVIKEIFKMEAEPFVSENRTQLVLTGDSYVLHPEVSPIFALTIHELMTNSVKYGSLSSPDGRLLVHIAPHNNGIEITWKEEGGPQARKPSVRGFGMNLIENAIPYEVDGESSIEFRPEGVFARFWLPSKMVSRLADAFVTDGASPLSETPSALVPANVLIVEDNMMLAIDMAETLERMGAKHVEKCANVAQATRILKTFSPGFAILDVRLGDDTSFEIAAVFKKNKVPFCFATGYGSGAPVPEAFKDVIVLTKPVETSLIESTIISLTK